MCFHLFVNVAQHFDFENSRIFKVRYHTLLRKHKIFPQQDIINIHDINIYGRIVCSPNKFRIDFELISNCFVFHVIE